jgi:flavin reductase (DIM6/NTAB) family NADH-FMN oxidoreductase RutF
VDTDVTVYHPDQVGRQGIYHLLTGVVVPRPIGWISTIDETGRPNLAPFSFFNVCSDDPPVVYFSSCERRQPGAVSGPVKDSVQNAVQTGEFVVNVVSADLLHQMVATAASLEPHLDEFAHAGLTTAPSVQVRPPRVAAARAAIECRLHSTVPLGAYEMVLGEVVALVVRREVMVDGRVDVTRLAPVGRLAGALYTLLG